MSPCNCGKKTGVKATYVVTTSTGEKKSFSSEMEAILTVKRLGGSYRRQ